MCRSLVQLRRGAVQLGVANKLKFETLVHPNTPHECGFIWTHGLASSMEDESNGGWPFAGVATVSSVMPCTRYDVRGHGTSDDACSKESTWPSMADDLIKISTVWGKPRTFIGGTSMGAAVSLYAALREPLRFSGLILATPPTCHQQRPKFVPMYLESVEAARQGGLKEANRLAATKLRPPIFTTTDEGKNMFEIGWRCKMAMGVQRYCAAMQGAAESDLPDKRELRNLTLPTLILAWRTDVQHPVSTARMLHENLPNSELVIASDWSEIQGFPRHMLDFLRRHL